MKANEIQSANVSTLREVAKTSKIDIKGLKKKEEIQERVLVHFQKDANKNEALENSRQAKRKDLPHRVKMAKVYDSFRVMLEDGKKEVKDVKGVVATFWKTSPQAADFGGVTLRFTADDIGGMDRAIVSNLRKALKGHIVSNTMTIRKGGSGALFF